MCHSKECSYELGPVEPFPVLAEVVIDPEALPALRARKEYYGGSAEDQMSIVWAKNSVLGEADMQK